MNTVVPASLGRASAGLTGSYLVQPPNIVTPTRQGPRELEVREWQHRGRTPSGIKNYRNEFYAFTLHVLKLMIIKIIYYNIINYYQCYPGFGEGSNLLYG